MSRQIPKRRLAALALISAAALFFAALSYSGVFTGRAPSSALDVHAKGIAAGGGYTTLSDADLANRLDGIVELGATWVRFDIDWAKVQPNGKNSTDWSNIDRVVDAARARHLQVLGIVNGSAAWARPAGCQSDACAPAKAQTYGNFAGLVASRYHGKIAALELGNEVNLREFMKPVPDPEFYAQMLKAAYKAIDHKIWVVAGSTTNINAGGSNIAPEDWLHRLYAAGGRGMFDAYSFHIYPAHKPSDKPDEAMQRLAKIHGIMASNHDGKKTIWITETGYSTSSSDPNKSVSEATQASNLAYIIKGYKALAWTGPLFIYSLRDDYNPYDEGTASEVGNYQNFFGLKDRSGRQKPAYSVVKRDDFLSTP